MKSNSQHAPGRAQLWIAASIILLAVIVGAVSLLNARRPAPERSAAPTPQDGISAASTIVASVAPPATSTATPAPTPAASPTPTPIAVAVAEHLVTPTPSVVRAKIEIVWPHDGASVRDAGLANITAYLIRGGVSGEGAGLEAPPCDWAPVVRLWGAVNNQPAREIAVGSKRMFSSGGRTFPVWDFNDISVADANDSANKLTFFVTVDGVTTLPNIWAHASDARTIFPQPDVPTDALSYLPGALDARIQIVWPHDDLPIAEAARANVTAYLFASGTSQALAPELSRPLTVRLHRSLNSDPEQADSTVLGEPRVLTTGTGVKFLAWDFNDVDVSATQDPLNRLYFWVTVDGVTTFSNIWAHGADARTIFPQVDLLESCR